MSDDYFDPFSKAYEELLFTHADKCLPENVVSCLMATLYAYCRADPEMAGRINSIWGMMSLSLEFDRSAPKDEAKRLLNRLSTSSDFIDAVYAVFKLVVDNLEIDNSVPSVPRIDIRKAEMAIGAYVEEELKNKNTN